MKYPLASHSGLSSPKINFGIMNLFKHLVGLFDGDMTDRKASSYAEQQTEKCGLMPLVGTAVQTLGPIILAFNNARLFLRSH
jgi:hypothetical protein